ncbi:hypothetical protein ACODM8_14965 [Vibrio ostreicida]|uniref:Gas vesicle protein n=1 Tax=Vibrio ostreicida TaxID=526588 RepID=A0ABT8C2V0_9VIBR|nr:hypothetical protein [Vibrio ostreicida]MDN3612545.1 hypothetical protein [Vibrio ostreicida]NPD09167.1 hypothetical protein [Vibrio ostreicida]
MITIEHNESLFKSMVSYTNKDNSSIGVTVFIGDRILTGELISEQHYFQLVNEHLSDSTENLSFNCSFLVDKMSTHESHYFHMKDAVFIDGYGQSMPTAGCLWRGRVSSVQAVSIGAWLLPKH